LEKLPGFDFPVLAMITYLLLSKKGESFASH